jgi:hypothetical protein
MHTDETGKSELRAGALVRRGMAGSSFILGVVGAICLGASMSAFAVDPPPPSAVVELLEDDAAGLLAKLTNPTGDPGQGVVENNDVFAGTAAIRIIPMQRFEPHIAGWNYRITERPKAGEFRYLRFAWRADAGAAGIMVQLHDEKDWNVRLTAGIDQYNWGTRFVAPKPPTKWTVVTCDLFAEFGKQERAIQGIALTVFGGQAGYFDHIYLARTVDDLDRIDATALGGGARAKLDAAALERLWRELSDDDAARAYRAFWTLANAPDQGVAFVAKRLAWPKSAEAAGQVRAWIRQLDADDFRAREEATRELADHMEAAAGLLADELELTASPEVRRRVEQLLARAKEGGGDDRRVSEAVRMLKYADTAEARRALAEFAKGEESAPLTRAAKAALEK